MGSELLQCYNRGCGQKFTPNLNKDDACCHHPGEPYFHDAYKGWTCCNRKSTDFTEFLNFKGCTVSKHSNVKPPEPQKPVIDVTLPETQIKTKPIIRTKERPSYNTPLTSIKPILAPSLTQIISNTSAVNKDENNSEIAIGTICKNGGCNKCYEGPGIDIGACTYHPGSPIFHEGMKYWSCCQKRTTDFNTFLNQIGCQSGSHVWKKENDDSKMVDCRWDFHQTGMHVIVSIYAKQYCPYTSTIKLSPIRLVANVIFPQQSNAAFNMDIELNGVINVNESVVNMYGTKIEIKLRKAEPGSWTKLDRPKTTESEKIAKIDDLSPKVEGVDLSDL